MEAKRKFILDTLLIYKNDPTQCGYIIEDNIEACLYLTKDGKKCAVGQHLKKGEWQKSKAGVVKLLKLYDADLIFTEEAKSMNLTVDEWRTVQDYHDEIAMHSINTTINDRVTQLEEVTGFKFEELRF